VGKAAANSKDGLHFTIGSAAGHDSPGALDLRKDLALAKATLLYADRVKLCSVGSSVLSGIAEYAEASTERRARLVVKFLPELQPSFTPDEIHFFEAVVGLRGREEKRRVNQRTRREVLNMVAEQRAELDAMVLEQHSAAGIHGFREAVKSGRLEVHPFRKTSAEAIVEAMLKGGGNLLYGIDLVDVLEEYIDQVSGAVADGSTYPVFDDLTGSFVAEAFRAGLITATETSADRSRYGGISSDLLRRLPLFETVSLPDAMDIRRTLEGPLRGFRLAIADFSEEIRSAAWDPGFSDEAEALFREKVEPEVERIEEEVRQNAGLAEFAWRTARHGATPAAFGGVIGTVSDLPTLTGAAAGALSGLGAAGFKALADRREKLKEIQANQLYFYYRAEREIGRRA
jgi:hypothetical protein